MEYEIVHIMKLQEYQLKQIREDQETKEKQDTLKVSFWFVVNLDVLPVAFEGVLCFNVSAISFNFLCKIKE